MNDLTFEQMQQMQRELHAKYLAKWGGLSPEKAVSKLLWLHGELGEASDIVKKQGGEAIQQDPATRARFVEEMCDALMYWNDVLLCYGITPQEIADTYAQKFQTNMNRW